MEHSIDFRARLQEMKWHGWLCLRTKKEAIVGWYRFLEPINIGYRSVRLQGLDPKLPYQISDMEMDIVRR